MVSYTPRAIDISNYTNIPGRNHKKFSRLQTGEFYTIDIILHLAHIAGQCKYNFTAK